MFIILYILHLSFSLFSSSSRLSNTYFILYTSSCRTQIQELYNFFLKYNDNIISDFILSQDNESTQNNQMLFFINCEYFVKTPLHIERSICYGNFLKFSLELLDFPILLLFNDENSHFYIYKYQSNSQYQLNNLILSDELLYFSKIDYDMRYDTYNFTNHHDFFLFFLETLDVFIVSSVLCYLICFYTRMDLDFLYICIDSAIDYMIRIIYIVGLILYIIQIIYIFLYKFIVTFYIIHIIRIYI